LREKGGFTFVTFGLLQIQSTPESRKGKSPRGRERGQKFGQEGGYLIPVCVRRRRGERRLRKGEATYPAGGRGTSPRGSEARASVGAEKGFPFWPIRRRGRRTISHAGRERESHGKKKGEVGTATRILWFFKRKYAVREPGAWGAEKKRLSSSMMEREKQNRKRGGIFAGKINWGGGGRGVNVGQKTNSGRGEKPFFCEEPRLKNRSVLSQEKDERTGAEKDHTRIRILPYSERVEKEL